MLYSCTCQSLISSRSSGYMLKRKRQIEQQMKFIPSFTKEGEDIDPSTSAAACIAI